jgi:hypothetical protein
MRADVRDAGEGALQNQGADRLARASSRRLPTQGLAQDDNVFRGKTALLSHCAAAWASR